MKCQRLIKLLMLNIVFFIIFLISSTPVYAGNLVIPNTFSQGDTVSADTMNDNFWAIEKEVNDNNDRITAVESTVSNAEIIRTISIPANALGQNDQSDIISQHTLGLLWSFNYAESATLSIRSPADYAGGDCTFHIFFRTMDLPATGVVDFFLRPTSFSAGDDTVLNVDVLSGEGVPIPVKGFYQQSFIIPSGLLSKDWWYVSIQRQGLEGTYDGDVYVLSVAFEYMASH